MPVSTRSQISGPRPPVDQEASAMPRDPHRGLKEKMRALTLLYEQHRKPPTASAAARLLPTHHPSVDLFDSSHRERDENQEEEEKGEGKEVEKIDGLVMKENLGPPPSPAKPAKRLLTFPRTDAKENCGGYDGHDRIAVYSCPKKVTVTAAAARRLSAGAQSEGRTTARGVKKMNAEMGTILENGEVGGSRILVFVRLRPMARKEREAGSRCCVKIVNRRDVYLTELASTTDYLRLKRLRGRHFCFDAAFPDSTTQQEVYTTT